MNLKKIFSSKKIISYIIIFILLLFNIYSNYLLYKSKLQINRLFEKIDNDKELLMTQYNNKGKFEKFENEFIQNNLNNEVFKNKLVYAFHQGSCYPCLSEQLNLLDNYFSDALKKSIVVIASFRDSKNLDAWMNSEGVSLKYINLNSLISPELLKKSFYFIIDDNYNLSMFYEPLPNMTDASKVYLNSAMNIIINSR